MVKYDALIEQTEDNKKLLNSDKCDKYDYLVAVGCGVIGGIIDIFLVGMPGDSKLSKFTDETVDNMVIAFAKKMGWKPRDGKEKNVASALGWLERHFKVNYDQRSSIEVNNLFNLNTKNHHMKSLAHSPDIVGLFFSILNQFTSTSSFISNGKVFTFNTETFELQGNNFVSRLWCGVVNWFAHIMSDVAGSSGSRGNKSRGQGIVMPFYELFGLCDFGSFQIEKDKQTLAVLAERAYKAGMDSRFGLAQAIPVIITNLCIRIIWLIRKHWGYGCPINECVPIGYKHEDLRVMLLLGNGTLCTIDVIDAGVRSDGNALLFFLRMNLVAWARFVMIVVTEICIRLGVQASMDTEIEAYRYANLLLQDYLAELEKIDIDSYKKEVEFYSNFEGMLSSTEIDDDYLQKFLDYYNESSLPKPYGDEEFDDFMSDSSKHLVYKRK